jgi:1-phosphatidylinositol phosphodiesterase
VGFNFGEGVRDVCVDFLQANPHECIVMQIKPEDTDGPGNVKTFQQVFDGYRQGFEDFFYTDDHIPTLSEVRGKIVLVRRFPLDSDHPADDPGGLGLTSPESGWPDDMTFDEEYTAQNGETVTFHIQDQYSLTASAEEKWPHIEALLDRAKADATDAWYINFSSATGIAALLFPNTVAGTINPQLNDYLGGAPFPARLGTLMMDFPDANIIGRIISLNTNK